MLCMCCGSPAERKHSAKSAPKSTKNVSGSTRKPPRAPTKQTLNFLCNFLAFLGPNHIVIFTHFRSKIGETCNRKNGQKTAPIQNYFFQRFFSFSDVARTILIDFGSQNGSQEGPGATFSRASPALGFQLVFLFSVKNAKRQKMKKCVSICKLHTILEVAPSK